VAKVPNGSLTERDLKGTFDLRNFSANTTTKPVDQKKAVPDPDELWRPGTTTNSSGHRETEEIELP
jgi:hypothetical protein